MATNTKIHYAATFSDGTVSTRNSYRSYTHAWRATCVVKDWNGQLRTWQEVGFSSSFALAERALADFARRVGQSPVTFREVVVPVSR